ncbi:MAG: protein kinase [Thermoanaerobaculia bacterium]|nr:protein kinase [Thermoanaerobaculia bacterium]
MIGTKLGPYEITAKLGAGGMGEVYRATDTKLDRQVAIKVLPAEFTADKERLARFEREAKLLAQLHHPNIASIFGMEESDGTRALVMELVEGPTLAERLEAGAFPFNECLSVSVQIAHALEEAHEKGIVHRDLKPQNIKASIEGKVKVLDFGLAKAMDPAAGGAASAADLARSPTMMHSPTLTAAHGTQMGVILGTAAYMAPEQAKGFAVDKRADIWAFGVVLYEMLTGRRLFEGDSVAETLSLVLQRAVDFEALPASTPAAVRRLLRRCLERNPKNRLHDIADARIVLEEVRSGAATEEVVGAAAPPTRPAPAKLAGAALLALGALAVALFVGRATATAPETAAASLGAGFHQFTRLTFQSGLESSPAISPDGEFVVFETNDGGDLDLFLLRVGGQRAIHLTEDAPADDHHPAFSPDGRFLAFRSERDGGGLFVMGATGESVRRLAGFGDNPAWSPDGREIVFATEGESDPHAREKVSELWVVPSAGGEPRRIFAGDAVQPAWSPGGHRIAFWRIQSGTGIRDVWTVAADGSDPRPVTDGPSVDWSPVWARDGAHLYFVSDRGGVTNPWRVAIDERTGEPQGAPEPVVVPTAWSGQLSLTADERRLVYRTSEMTSEIRRLAFDPAAGRPVGPLETLVHTAIPAVGLDVAADGLIAFRTAAMQEDVYVLQTDGGGLRKLTDDDAKDRNPVWSPDGRALAFYSNRGGRYEIWTVDRDGSNLRQRTAVTDLERVQVGGALFPIWAPDGRAIAFSSFDQVVRFELRDLPASSAEMEVLPVDAGDGLFVLPLSWSPDGARIAGVRIGQNGQLLGGIVVYELASKTTRFLPLPAPTPPSGHIFPTLTWLPDSRRGVIRWGSRLLLVETTTGAVTTLVGGLNPDGGIARLTPDGRALYMLDSRNEGDLWMADRRRDLNGRPRPDGANPAS